MIKKEFYRTDRILFFSSFFGIITKFLYCKLGHFPNKTQSNSEVNRNFITNMITHQKQALLSMESKSKSEQKFNDKFHSENKNKS